MEGDDCLFPLFLTVTQLTADNTARGTLRGCCLGGEHPSPCLTFSESEEDSPAKALPSRLTNKNNCTVVLRWQRCWAPQGEIISIVAPQDQSISSLGTVDSVPRANWLLAIQLIKLEVLILPFSAFILLVPTTSAYAALHRGHRAYFGCSQ